MPNSIDQILAQNPSLNQVSHSDILPYVANELKHIDSTILGISTTINTIADKFLINTTHPELVEFSSSSARAYPATVEGDMESYYCLIFSNNLPNRLAEMITLKATSIVGLIHPIALEISRIERHAGQLLCAICKTPRGKSLKEWVKSKRKFSQQFILDTILPQLNKIIFHLHTQGIVHGRINPSNIYLDEENHITIGDCISDLSGALQPACYETIHRGQTHKYAKGVGDKSIDYYALGMTIFSILSSIFLEDNTKIDIIENKLQEGSYNFLCLNFSLTGIIADLIKGLVIDDQSLRWGNSEVETLLMDGNYSVSKLIDKSILPRSIIFNDVSYSSKSALAYALSKNWQAAKLFLKQSSLVKWLNISIQEQPTVEALEKLQTFMNRRAGAYAIFSKEDEYLMKVIILLDPYGPLRYQDIALNKEGLGPLLAYSIANQNNEMMQFIANTLFVDFFSFYEQIAMWLDNNYHLKELSPLKHATSMIRTGGYGFGIERCHYDLNPSLPAIGNILNGELLYGARDLLRFINDTKLSIDDLLSRKSLLCFFASKIDMVDNLTIATFQSFYALEKEKAFVSLEILSIAQEITQIGKLTNLSELYAEKIKTVLNELIKGDSIKKNIFALIDKTKSSGDLKLLKQSATNSKYFEQDIRGFTAAINRVHSIQQELITLKKKDVLSHKAKERGLKFAVIVSYIIVIISILLSIIKRG